MHCHGHGQAHSLQFSLLLLCCNTVWALSGCCQDKCEITSSQHAKVCQHAKYLRRTKLLLTCKLTTFLEGGAFIKIFVGDPVSCVACFEIFVEPVLNPLENLFVVEPVLKCCSSIATPAVHHLLGFQLKAKTDLLGAEVANIENIKSS